MIFNFASRPAAAFSPPPGYGDWVIDGTEPTTWSTGAVLKGNLLIKANATLILTGANITFDCAQKCQYGIKVETLGTLQASNALLVARDSDLPFTFKINTNADVSLDHCTIRGVGAFAATLDTWGIYVHSSNTTITGCKITECNVGLLVHGFVSPAITGNNISGNLDRGIWCKYSSPSITNNRFADNAYGIYIENDSLPVLLNNEFANNRKEGIFMAPGCVSDWTISQPCTWVGSEMTYRGNLSVESGGTLVMQGCDLGMAALRGGLLVRSGGQLSLTGTTLQAAAGNDAYSLVVEAGGNMTVASSVIKNAGWAGAPPSRSGPYIAGRAIMSGSDLRVNQASLICDRGFVTVMNCTLGGTWMDLVMFNSTARLINVSMNAARASVSGESSVLEVCWYLSVGAVWQNGQGISGAPLTVKYSSGAAIYDGTPSDGWARWLVVTQRRTTAAGTTDTANVSILARRVGFDELSRTVAVISNREERLVFYDPTAPVVTVTAPADGYATNRTSVQIRGTASDAIGLESVEYSLDESPRWTALPPGEWSITLSNVTRGLHRLSVRAIDYAGLTSFANLTFLVDTEPPRLELDDPFDESVLVNHTGVRFAGTTEAGVNLTIGDAVVEVGADGRFDFTLTVPAGQSIVRVVSTDRAGNAVSLVRRIMVDLSPPSIIISSPVPGFKTRQPEVQLVGRIEPGAKFRVDGSTVSLGADGSFNTTILLSGGLKTVELYAEDPAGNGNTTTFTIERRLDPAPGGGTFMERYGLYMAVGIVAVIALVAGLAAAIGRRKGRKSVPAPAPRARAEVPEAIPVEESGSVDDVLYGEKPAGPQGGGARRPPGRNKKLS